MAKERYFVLMGDSQVGPLGIQQVRNMRSAGTIKQETLLWREGDPEWLPSSAFAAVLDDEVTEVNTAPEPMPAEPMPAEPMPAEPAPVEVMPAEPVPAEPAPVEAMPAEPMPAAPMLDDPVLETPEPMPAAPMPSEPTPAAPVLATPEPMPAAPMPAEPQAEPAARPSMDPEAPRITPSGIWREIEADRDHGSRDGEPSVDQIGNSTDEPTTDEPQFPGACPSCGADIRFCAVCGRPLYDHKPH